MNNYTQFLHAPHNCKTYHLLTSIYIYITQKRLFFHLHITIIHKRLNPILQNKNKSTLIKVTGIKSFFEKDSNITTHIQCSLIEFRNFCLFSFTDKFCHTITSMLV